MNDDEASAFLSRGVLSDLFLLLVLYDDLDEFPA